MTENQITLEEEKKKPYPLANYQEYRESRNPYAAKVKELEPYLGNPKTLLGDGDTEAFRGKWREHFQCKPEVKLNLELGVYHGETSIHLAKTNPEWMHLGIEWKYKVCFKAGKKARDHKLKNMTFLRANNARLPWMFKRGEVNRVWVLFPDPWSKVAQNKWRLLQPEFFQVIGALLDEGAELLLKTDHQEYFEFFKEAVFSTGLFQEMNADRAKAIWTLIPPTPFERIFLRQGLPVYPLALERNRSEAKPPEWAQAALHSD